MFAIHRIALSGLAVAAVIAGCGAAPPRIRFAPDGTDVARLRTEFPLTDAERQALTPESIKRLNQAELDQIYLRLESGPIPDGPFRGDLFFPRDARKDVRLGELEGVQRESLGTLAAMRLENLGRMLWRGKVFFRSQGVLRNRIEDIAILRPLIPESHTIPKLTFDGQTTWLLFPAALSCGESRLDATRKSIVIDYAKGPTIEGYREIPDRLAGPDRLAIRDEVRIIRPGFYLGRAYFRDRFGLNFTLFDPAAAAASTPLSAGDCTQQG